MEEKDAESIDGESSTFSKSPSPSPSLRMRKKLAEAFAPREKSVQQKIKTKQSSPSPPSTPEKVCKKPSEKVKHDAIKDKEKTVSRKVKRKKEKEKGEYDNRPWSKCYQPASAIASCPNDDILLLICNQYIDLEDNIALGQTCRRLYTVYRQAMGCVRHLQLTHLDVYPDYRPPYENYETRLWDFGNPDQQEEEGEEDQLFQPAADSALRNLQITLNGETLLVGGQYQLMPSFLLTSGLLSSAQLPNLTCLDLTTGHLGTSFFLPDLFGSLNSLQRLEILKLNVRCRHWLVDQEGGFPSVKSAVAARGPSWKISQLENSNLLEPPCAQLRLPVLKHLTLALKNIRLCEKGQKVEKRRKSLPGRLMGWLRKNIAKRGSPSDCTFAIDCPQLNSFNFSSADKLTDVCKIIRQTVLSNPQLANSIEYGQVQIIQQLLRDNTLPEELDSEALAQITHLWVEHQYEDEPLLRLLPTLRGLQEIKLFVRDVEEVARHEAVLAALSTLPYLHSVLIDCRDSRYGNEYVALPPRLTTPIQLPSVTSLSLMFSSVYHDQMVEKYYIAECFPNLITFRATIVLNCCRFCNFMVGPSHKSARYGAPRGKRKHPLGPVFELFNKRLMVVNPNSEAAMRRHLMPCARALTADLSTLFIDPQQMEICFMGPTMKIIPYLTYNTVEKRMEWAPCEW